MTLNHPRATPDGNFAGIPRLPSLWLIAMLLHGLVAWLGTQFCVFFGFRSVSPFSDLQLYNQYARQMARGAWPYRDFLIEYPPLAVPFFVLPAQLTGLLSPWLTEFAAYRFNFVVEMILIDAVALWLVIQHDAVEFRRAVGRLLWYTAYFVVLCPLDVTRYDMAPMLAGFLAAVAFSRGWLGIGTVAASLGTLIKIVPGLVLIPLLAGTSERSVRRQRASQFCWIIGTVATGWFLVGGSRSWESVQFHLERGVEINSLYASFYLIGHWLTPIKLQTNFGHGSINILAPGVDILARIAFLAQFGCLGLVWLQAYWQRRPYSIPLAAASILGYMIAGKVFSPQYMIWLIPFAAVIPAGRGLFLTASLLTSLTYPWMFGDLINLAALPALILLSRNLILIWLLSVWLRVDSQLCLVNDQTPTR